jgi:hypothetical protein
LILPNGNTVRTTGSVYSISLIDCIDDKESREKNPRRRRKETKILYAHKSSDLFQLYMRMLLTKWIN